MNEGNWRVYINSGAFVSWINSGRTALLLLYFVFQHLECFVKIPVFFLLQ